MDKFYVCRCHETRDGSFSCASIIVRRSTYQLHDVGLLSWGSKDTCAASIQRTQQPIVTGTSILAIKYKNGVMMAADKFASYGSLTRFKDVQCLHQVGNYTMIGAGGDISNFQHIQ
ncbi:hypothetical protein BDR07DRAFT_1383630 [Suillus spraguei]|nr:hypothetical protein BDR07DRAFT_1384415 [Suillus spraguei]KAG2353024.1 hypothetical protein BDR07DRAFT_1383630 [Suillus spraguei]